jgi:hypothetical protein
MFSTRIWWLFILVIGLIAAWYVYKASDRLYLYYTLSKNTSAYNLQWSIKEINSDEFLPSASYVFKLENGEEIRGKSDLVATPYRNPWSAEEGIKELNKQSWNVWYNPSKPQLSALQKVFPLKDSIYALMMLGLLAYFIGLGYYVSRQRKDVV